MGISLGSNWTPPPNTVLHEQDEAKGKRDPGPGDGYRPPFDYGDYALVAYGETPLPLRYPGQPEPWTPVPNYPPKLGTTPGLERSFAVSASDAVRRPGIVGTDPDQGTDPRTDWRPQYTIQQQAIQAALRQRTAM